MTNKQRWVLVSAVLVSMAVMHAPAHAQNAVGFNAVGTYAWVTGASGDALSGGPGAEASVFYQMRQWGFGVGGSYYAVKMNDPLGDLTWGRVNIFGLFRYELRTAGVLAPHFSARVGWAQFSPDQQLNVEKASGLNVGFVLGTEIALSDNFAFDVSALLENFNVSDVDLSGVDLDTVNWGWLWGLRGGFTVRP